MEAEPITKTRHNQELIHSDENGGSQSDSSGLGLDNYLRGYVVLDLVVAVCRTKRKNVVVLPTVQRLVFCHDGLPGTFVVCLTDRRLSRHVLSPLILVPVLSLLTQVDAFVALRTSTSSTSSRTTEVYQQFNSDPTRMMPEEVRLMLLSL